MVSFHHIIVNILYVLLPYEEGALNLNVDSKRLEPTETLIAERKKQDTKKK